MGSNLISSRSFYFVTFQLLKMSLAYVNRKGLSHVVNTPYTVCLQKHLELESCPRIPLISHDKIYNKQIDLLPL